MINYQDIPSPCYVVEEARLRKNLSIIKRVADEAGVQIIMALKAQALYPIFPIVREYVAGTTASSLGEAMLAKRYFGTLTHTYAPVYAPDEFPAILSCSSHVTFNSLSQYKQLRQMLQRADHTIHVGLRVNPMWSEVETDLYNPCAIGSRLGVTPELIANGLPEGIEGVHFHTLCESMDTDLEKTLHVVEQRFEKALNQAKWINMGGGHLMTHKDYDVNHLISLLLSFKKRHPHLQVILEPGAAFVWRTGELVATVLDIVENGEIKTAMLNVSFACHMPDCLEMPYQPQIVGARQGSQGAYVYRMGGNSCLSGDYVGDWSFDHELKVGERIVFEDMIHYTFVKTTLFNGVSHPSIGIWNNKGFQLFRQFTSSDYIQRMG